MSFNITLQKFSGEKIALDKTTTDLITVSGVLREETSIVNPVIRIAGDLSNYVKADYMTIPVFGRSYFITDIRSVRDGLFEVSGHCDVLSSFKTGIRANRAIIRRGANIYNLYLDDGSFKVYNNPKVLAANFPGGFSTMQYILAIAGGGGSNDE